MTWLLLVTLVSVAPTYEIVVVGKRKAPESAKADKSGVNVTVKPSQIIKQGRRLSDVLAEAPGVSQKSTGGVGHLSLLMIRGSSPAQVNWYLDGFRIMGGAGGTLDAGAIPLAGIGKISLFKSAVPLELGVEGIGGAVNIVPLRPTKDIMSCFHTLGSHGTMSTSFVLGGMKPFTQMVAGSLLTTRGNYRYFYDSGTEYTRSDDGFRERSNNRVLRGNLLYSVTTKLWGTSFRIYSTYGANENGVPGPGSMVTRNTRYAYERGALMLKAIRTTGALRIATGAWVEGVWDRFEDPFGELGVGVQRDTSRVLTAGGLLFGTWRSPRHSLTFGARGNTSVLSATKLMLTEEQREARAQLSTGVRYRYRGAHLFAQGSAQLLGVREHSSDLYHSVKGGVRYLLVKGLSVKANVASAVRLPSFLELYGDTGALKGNDGLLPEQSLSMDLSARYRLYGLGGRITMEAGGFYKRISNLIQYIPNSQFIARAENIADAEVRGGESTLEYKQRFAYAKLTYTRLFTKNRSILPYQDGNPLPGRPDHALHFRLKATLPLFGWRISPEYSFTGLIGGNFDASARRPMPSRLLHSLGVTLVPPEKKMTLVLSFQNMGSSLYEMVERRPVPASGPMANPQAISNYIGYPIPGFTWFITLSTTL